MLINDAAIRCFRDTADQDYIAARLSYFAELMVPSLWQSQQTLEKYLKCILLLQRVPARDVGHSLAKAIQACEVITAFKLNLTEATRDFIAHLEAFEADRYLTLSTYAEGRDLIRLDRAVWELRRFCTLEPRFWSLSLQMGVRPSRYALEGGLLESILSTRTDTRKGLVRQNGFWGDRKSTKVRRPGWLKASNSPLYMHPEILGELEKLIFVPKVFGDAFKQHSAPDVFIPEGGLEMELPS